MSPLRGHVLTCLVAVAAFALAFFRPGAGCGTGDSCAHADGDPSLQPAWVKVEGGEENWHASSLFMIEWEIPSHPPRPLGATHYRIRNSEGMLVTPDTTIGGAQYTLAVTVPMPGMYAFEIWMSYADGTPGPIVKAKLRYDVVPPGETVPIASPGWIGRTAIPYAISLSHPAAPLPVSGIRGYAVSVSETTEGNPCVAIDRCSDAETDLRGGIGDDRYAIPALAEGTSYVHAVAVSGSGIKSTVPGVAALHVDKTDPVTTLGGAPGEWTNQAVTLTAIARDSLSGMEPAGDGGSFTAIRVDGGAPKTADGDSVSAAVIGEGAHTVAYYARDAAGNVNDGGASNGLANARPGTTTIRIDKSAPKASFSSSQDPEDPEAIEVRVGDQLSGPDRSRGQIAVRRFGSEEQFEPLPTGVAEGRLKARWNSEDYPAGEYEFRATAYDAAGNSSITTKRANGTSMVLSNPLKVPTAVRAGFGGKVLTWQRCVRREGRRRCRHREVESFDARPSERLVPYGRNVLFSGRLTAEQHSPLAHMPVQVVERFLSGSNPVERVTTVQTSAEGSFAVRLAPGPTRQVSVAFQGTRTLSRSETAPVRLGVGSEIRMHASATSARIGGRPVVFSGKVERAGTTIPPDGKAVQLQFRVGRLPWTEFRTVQTDARGRFRYAYAFTDDDSLGVDFEFRALAPSQSGWPYEPAASRPIVVRGA